MKFTGIIRGVDKLGRFSIPKEIREQGEIEPGESVEIFVEPEKENIVLKKYQPGCIFCDAVEVKKRYKGKAICEDCLAEMKSELKN